MNWSADEIGTINQRSAQANSLSSPPIGCVLHLLGLPGGGSKIYDRSPYGNIGTITGAVWKRLPSGLWVLEFDGNDDSALIAANPCFEISEAITVEIWVNILATGTDNRGIIEKTPLGNQHGDWNIYTDANDKIIFESFDISLMVSTDTLTLEQWYFIAATYDRQTARLYQDGAEVDTQDITTALPTNNQPIYLGMHFNTEAKRRVNGRMNLARVHNRALSALEIQNHFNREKHLFGVW